MDREQIISEIKRTAAENDGIPLGQKTFERETGIATSAWRGRYWRNWGDAVKDAGFEARNPNQPHDRTFLILSLVRLTQKNQRFPTYADVRLAREADKSFPAHQPITALGTVEERIELVRQYAKENPDFHDVLALLPEPQALETEDQTSETTETLKEGFVYMGLLRVGRERRYKIGKAVLVERRTDQISIQLPEDLELVHTIRTDDAYGIEKYWHTRFASKNTKGEWFSLSQDEVRAFKKRKFM